jgi:isopenicillin N synthase-like dioxygenase
VNIGDLLSYWTNGLLKSTVHRVIFPVDDGKTMRDRYSLAYFSAPVSTTVLDVVPSEKVAALGKERGSTDRKKITAHEHLMGRLKGTYFGLYGEET